MSFEEIMKTVQYNKDCRELKAFIAVNYKDSDLIDFEYEHK